MPHVDVDIIDLLEAFARVDARVHGCGLVPAGVELALNRHHANAGGAVPAGSGADEHVERLLRHPPVAPTPVLDSHFAQHQFLGSPRPCSCSSVAPVVARADHGNAACRGRAFWLR